MFSRLLGLFKSVLFLKLYLLLNDVSINYLNISAYVFWSYSLVMVLQVVKAQALVRLESKTSFNFLLYFLVLTNVWYLKSFSWKIRMKEQKESHVLLIKVCFKYGDNLIIHFSVLLLLWVFLLWYESLFFHLKTFFSVFLLRATVVWWGYRQLLG